MTGKKIFMIGIKGVGMTSLAIVLQRMGNIVSGSDVAKHFITDKVLEKYGITVYQGFDEKHITSETDLFVISGAHANPNNAEYVAIEKLGITIKTHAEALGEVMDESALKISVCGSHGKTTTSAMLATIFSASHMKGGHQIGVPFFSSIDGGAYNGGDYFIAEADEYVNKPIIDLTPRFSFQHPDILLCTNIDYDHPDVYASLGEVQAAFNAFMNSTIDRGGKVLYCADDHQTSPAIQNLAYDKLYSYGLSKSADLVVSRVIDNENTTSFSASFRDTYLGEFQLRIGGAHNILNAAGAVLASHLSGLDNTTIARGLSEFTGSARRFELIEHFKSTYLYDDYAHHPQEITAVLQAAKSKYPNNRIIVIFQPHTFSRTTKFESEFLSSLEKADKAYILQVFSSERETSNAQSEVHLGHLYTIDEVYSELRKEQLNNTTIITMGAGDVYTMHPALLALVKASYE